MTQSGDLAPLIKHLANLGGPRPRLPLNGYVLVPARHYFQLTYLQLFIHLRFPNYRYLLYGSSCPVLSLHCVTLTQHMSFS